MTSLEDLFVDRVAVVVPDVIGSAAATAIRERLEIAGYQRYTLLDRGSYDVHDHPHEPALLTALTDLAAKLTDRTLAVAEARVLRLHPGDYLLAHHDRLHADHPVELVLDLGASSVPAAEVHYRRRGQVFFRVLSRPGSCSVVERGPTVICNHTYVSKLHVGASIVRMIVLLREVR